MWGPCRRVLQDFARRWPDRSERALVHLAAIAARHEGEPRHALRLLAMVRRDALEADDVDFYDTVVAEAEHLRDVTPLELAADEQDDPRRAPEPARTLPPERRPAPPLAPRSVIPPRVPAGSPVESARRWLSDTDMLRRAAPWAARLGVVLLAGVVWYRISMWIGVSDFTAALLGAVAAILVARWLALQALR